MVFEEHTMLEMSNVISLRAEMTQQEANRKSKEIERFLQEKGIKKTGPFITTTYAVKQGIMNPIMDLEILVPIEKKIALPQGYVWKPKFLLTNALKVKHIGNPNKLNDTIIAMNNYIKEHNLVTISPGYTVTINNPSEDVEIDLYISISPNIL